MDKLRPMMSIEDDLSKLAALVSDPAFKQQQQAFFDKHCAEFSTDEENKLSYTTIYKEYEQQLESEINTQLGSDAINRLIAGLEAYLKNSHEKRLEVAEAIDILTNLADFEAFKGAMLARKRELETSGPGTMKQVKGILSVDDCMERIKDLQQAASSDQGWREVSNTSDLVAYTKDGEQGTYCRLTLKLALSPRQCLEMFVNTGPESLAWRSNLSNVELLKDFGPTDKVVMYNLSLPWAIRYVLSVPPKVCVRIVYRVGWPEPQDYAYVAVPYDSEKNVVLEQMGPMGIKTGIISPNLEDPNQCIITTCDLANLGIMPSWGLGYLIRTMVQGQLYSMVDLYKKTDVFKKIQSSEL